MKISENYNKISADIILKTVQSVDGQDRSEDGGKRETKFMVTVGDKITVETDIVGTEMFKNFLGADENSDDGDDNAEESNECGGCCCGSNDSKTEKPEEKK